MGGVIYFEKLGVLTASLISGLTKAFIGTQNNGAKEVSFSDHTHSGYASSSHNHDSVYSKLNHTHTASQVSGVLKVSYGVAESGSFSVSFYPVCLILVYGYSANANARSDICVTIRPSSYLIGVTVSISYRTDPIPGLLMGAVTWSNSSIELSNFSPANMQYIIFGT